MCRCGLRAARQQGWGGAGAGPGWEGARVSTGRPTGSPAAEQKASTALRLLTCHRGSRCTSGLRSAPHRLHTAPATSQPRSHSCSAHPPPPCQGTRNVVEACIRGRVPKLVYTSSASVVFEGRDLLGVDEATPYAKKPLDYYTHTKIEGGWAGGGGGAGRERGYGDGCCRVYAALPTPGLSQKPGPPRPPAPQASALCARPTAAAGWPRCLCGPAASLASTTLCWCPPLWKRPSRWAVAGCFCPLVFSALNFACTTVDQAQQVGSGRSFCPLVLGGSVFGARV